MTVENLNKIVVIGCSGSGALAARMLKKLNPSLDVTIIREQEERGLLTRCATPYVATGNVTVDASYKDDKIFTEPGINLVNVKAVGIDKASKKVTTADGMSYPYDKLVLATGASPMLFPIQGVDLGGVFTLRMSGDAVNIFNWINSKRVKNMVLVGAGAIGLEIAYLSAQHGLKVTIVEKMEHVMSGVLDVDMSEDLEKYILEKGVGLKCGQMVKSIKGETQVQSVELSSGETIEAEMVIMSGGVKPNTDLAKNAELEIGQFGLKVNEYLQTSDPDIYAAGDVIEYENFVTGKVSAGRLRPNAVIGGRLVAKNILGYNLKYPGFINSFGTQFFDKSIAGAGLTESQAAENGIETVAARQSSISMHSMMKGRKAYTVKMVFDKKSEKIIGGQIVSDTVAPAKHIDVIALAIRNEMTALDMSTLRCAGQPELSPDPGIEPISLAAESAFHEFYKKTNN